MVNLGDVACIRVVPFYRRVQLCFVISQHLCLDGPNCPDPYENNACSQRVDLKTCNRLLDIVSDVCVFDLCRRCPECSDVVLDFWILGGESQQVTDVISPRVSQLPEELFPVPSG